MNPSILPGLPSPTRERWQPLRSGLLNLFRYDHEEFRWEDGHLLLRGNNGTGKSRVLALQLPFLLDGEVSSSRLEPDGDPARRVEWNLLLDRYKDRLGYTWLELGRKAEDGQERYLTLGCGLHAAEGRGLVGKWFFITRQRIGRDLFLQTASGQVFTRDRLTAALGADGEVFTTASAYRREVDARLFKLGEQRYEALVSLLIELRKPQLSRALDEKSLSDALSEALPPPSPAILGEVAESFRSLETDRAHLASFASARAAVQAFLDKYRRYAQIAARRRAEALRSAHADYEAIRRKLRAAEEALATSTRQQREAAEELERLATDDSKAQAELQALSASPAMRNAEALEGVRRAADERRREADAAEAELQQARSARERAAARLDAAARQSARTREALLAAEAEAAAGAEASGVLDAYRAATAALGLPDPGDARAAGTALGGLEAEGERRLLASRHLMLRNRDVAETLARLTRAREAQADAEAARDAEVDRERQARAELDAAADELSRAYRAWSETALELAPAPADQIEDALAAWCVRAEGRSPVAIAVADATAAASHRVAALRADAERRRREAARNLEAQRIQRERLLGGEHRPPPPPPTRDEAGRAQRAGAPLWKLCDFAPGFEAGRRAGLEAALEASGLLDAWVAADGRGLGPGDYDRALAVDTSPLPPDDAHLGRVLVPAVDRGDPRCAAVSDETVRAVLRHIGWGPGAGSVWVADDGRWQLGPVHGAWTKPEAEHLGEGSREASRRQRLRTLDLQLTASRAALELIDGELEALAARDRAAREESSRAPSDDAVRQAVAHLTAAARAVGSARARLARAEEAVVAHRSAHVDAAAGRDRDAQDLGLAGFTDDPQRLEDAVRRYQRALAGLRPRLDGHLASVEQATLAAESAREAAAAESAREVAALEARRRAAAAEHARDALQRSVGAEVQDVVARLEEARRRLDDVRGRTRDAHDQERRLYGLIREAETQIGDRREELERRAAVRDAALASLARFVGTKLLAVAHEGLSDVETGPSWAARGVETARRVEELLAAVDCDPSAWERSQRDVQRQVQELISTLGAERLQPSYELVDDLIVVSAVFQGRARTVRELADDLAGEVASRQTLLNAREREVIENHLLGEVATHLHDRLRAAEALRESMNDELQARPTSTGMTLRFVWRPREDDMPGLVDARKLLLRSTATWSPHEREAVGAFLQREIQRVRAQDEAATWQEHLARALDYRAWHQFAVERLQDGQWKRLTRRTHGTGSGGEKAIALTIPKFAAAAAHYKTADPLAPRLILLDEAFVGVDSDMRSKSMGLLHTFDLDFLMTSEREWGCYATLPGLAIYQLATRPGIDAIGVTRWLWNGRERALAEHAVSPPSQPALARAEG